MSGTIVWTPEMLQQVEDLLHAPRVRPRRVRVALDPDVLAFFTHRGRIDHARINAVLRVYAKTYARKRR